MTDEVFFLSFFGMISFVIWVVVNGWQRRQHVILILGQPCRETFLKSSAPASAP